MSYLLTHLLRCFTQFKLLNVTYSTYFRKSCLHNLRGAKKKVGFQKVFLFNNIILSIGLYITLRYPEPVVMDCRLTGIKNKQISSQGVGRKELSFFLNSFKFYQYLSLYLCRPKEWKTVLCFCVLLMHKSATLIFTRSILRSVTRYVYVTMAGCFHFQSTRHVPYMICLPFSKCRALIISGRKLNPVFTFLVWHPHLRLL